MFKKLILAGAGVVAAASMLPANVSPALGGSVNNTAPVIGNIGANIGAGTGQIIGSGICAWSLPWTPFSWGLALPAMNWWSWW